MRGERGSGGGHGQERQGGWRGVADTDHGRRGHGGHSAQTFRRGRAVAFLERLQVMRSTLAAQLNQPEFQSIAPVISGELKAVDQIIQAFIQTFELRAEELAGDRSIKEKSDERPTSS